MASYHHVKKAMANNIHQRRQKTKSWKHIFAANPWPDHQNESEDADSERSGEIRRASIFPEHSEGKRPVLYLFFCSYQFQLEGTDDADSISETASYRNYYEEMVNDRPPSSANVSTWEYGIHWTRRAYSDTTRSSYRESFGTRGENLSFRNKARVRAYGYEVTSPIHEEEQPSSLPLNARTVVEPIVKSTTPAPLQSRLTLSSPMCPDVSLADSNDMDLALMSHEAAVLSSRDQEADATWMVEEDTFSVKEIIPDSTRPAVVENVPRKLEPIHHPNTSTKNRITRGNSQRAPIDINQDNYIPMVEADHWSYHPPPHDLSRKIPQAPGEVKKTVPFILGDTRPVSHGKTTRDEKFFWQPSNNIFSRCTDATKRQAIYITNDILQQFAQEIPAGGTLTPLPRNTYQSCVPRLLDARFLLKRWVVV